MNSKKFIYPVSSIFQFELRFEFFPDATTSVLDSIQRYSFCKHLRWGQFFRKLKSLFQNLRM
ncbi:hypothetical protein DQM68_07440 [Leptospira mayottensis]|uniref:Uncharacterized protein n=2 Tax=Leptospira mayottensis TaxID=1137606 RepID=A0AA87MQV9_9LEPT|nr:hypothetical protein DQM68_07440 [Leptospira mayottensis]AXR64351.1 hypothetical protein DQM28_09125 [Leptospira mayottensis]AZQ03026.1 hypothetical protein LEP1GSC190_14245 [Leptospira mayottensis 200901116]EKS02066.1 hypothetical protein LEP1GSC125_0928 [Leptospira mayottensis 200901122]TGN17015.1 hypothetical protein EHR03_02820 [Leptospira mayottensis]